jgi:acyl-[acyl-carrier-protein]-phospholipid O-acyltransferase/long-chain-fatty-acid--[acyl-carrier-protein] ligase
MPVNLNFTAGKAALEASLQAGRRWCTVLTADAVRQKVPNFPWPERTLDLKQAIEACGGKKAIVPWLLAAWLLPNQWYANLLGLPKVGDREEAGLLFTSGSSGEPKGVVLTHRNMSRELRADFVALHPARHRRAHGLPAGVPQLRLHSDALVSAAARLQV